VDELDAQVRRLLIEEAINDHRRAMESLRYRVEKGEPMEKDEPQRAHNALYNSMLEAITE
jgi:hypothetical protein